MRTGTSYRFMVFIINDREVLTQAPYSNNYREFPRVDVYIEYDPGTKTLKVVSDRRWECYNVIGNPNYVMYLVSVLPKAFVEDLPKLTSFNIVFECEEKGKLVMSEPKQVRFDGGT